MDKDKTKKKKRCKSIEEILGLVPVKHDLFISYAHSDNQDGLVDKILKKIKEIYRALTGEQLRIFIDHTDIMTADLWQDRISVELRQSRLLLAMLSPSYFKSEWCRREWFMAEDKEEKINIFQGSSLISGAIVPILIYPLKRARLSKEEKHLVSTAKGRQWQDFSETKPGTAKSLQLVKRLVEDIIDNLDGLRSIIKETKKDNSEPVIIDYRTGLMWSGDVPPVQMTYEDANEYVISLGVAGYDDWRLPSKDEIESLLEPDLIPNDPHTSPVPLRPPFNYPRHGYLISGTILESIDNGYYVMNLRNGHIFNGLGYKCFVRAVRGSSRSKGKEERRTKASSRRPKGCG